MAHRGEAVRVVALRRGRQTVVVAGDGLDAPDRSRRRPHARHVHRGVRGVQPDHARAPRKDGAPTDCRATTTRSSPRSRAACAGTASARRARPRPSARPGLTSGSSSTARSRRATTRGRCSSRGSSVRAAPDAVAGLPVRHRPRLSRPRRSVGAGARGSRARTVVDPRLRTGPRPPSRPSTATKATNTRGSPCGPEAGLEVATYAWIAPLTGCRPVERAVGRAAGGRNSRCRRPMRRA